MNLMNQTPIFTPASLLTCYNSALKVAVEAYPITVQGIYRPDRMNKLYGGVFYDRLIQESGKEELVIKVRPAQREQLSGKAEKLITIYGFVNRKVRPDSVIGVSLDLESVLNVEESKVSEDEKQFWNLQREKAQSGKKDVSLLFKNRLFSNEKPRVALLWATSSCTRTEFNNAAGNAAQSIEFVQLDTTFANIAQTVRTLKEVDFFSVFYILILWLFAQVAGPNKGNAEVATLDGKVVGAANVGQMFTKDIYFWGRPSCAGDGYDASSSSGSNKGPTNPEYLAEVEARIDTFLVHHPYLSRKDVPAEMVTASASGLDPNITPQCAYVQIKRVAQARGLTENQVKEIVDQSVEKPLLGIFGTEKINVLKLNIALEENK